VSGKKGRAAAKPSASAEWVRARRDRRKEHDCAICRNPQALATLRELLAAMAELGAHRVSRADLLGRLVELHGVRMTSEQLRRHLERVDLALWQRAKGRA